MPSDKPFLSFVIDEKLLKAVDDFRFQYRFSSRAEAIRELIRRGLRSKEKVEVGEGGSHDGR